MSLYQNRSRFAPTLIKFESKFPSLMSLSVPVVLIDWEMLRALWRTWKITSHLKFSSIFTKCTRTNESYIPFVILPWCKWVKLSHSKVWVCAVMGTNSRHWFLQNVDAKSRKTGSKTNGKKTERIFQPFFKTNHGPLALIFRRLINLTHDLMKNFSSLDVHLWFHFILRL